MLSEFNTGACDDPIDDHIGAYRTPESNKVSDRKYKFFKYIICFNELLLLKVSEDIQSISNKRRQTCSITKKGYITNKGV